MGTAAASVRAVPPAGAPFASRRYATTSRCSSSVSEPSAPGGIELLVRAKRSAGLRSAQNRRKLSPASCGASKLPCRLTWWQAAHSRS